MSVEAKLDFVVFGFNDWETWESDGFCTRCAQIVTRMSARPEVGKTLVVSQPKSVVTRAWRSLFGKADYSGKVLRRGLWFALRQVEPDIFVLDHYRILPREASSDLLFRVNRFLHRGFLQREIIRVTKNLGFRDHVLWVANPLMIENAGFIGEKLTVFDAIDDWRLHPQKRGIRNTLIESYERIPDRAGAILTVSKALEEQFSRRNRNVHWLPNGVDVAEFARPRPLPSELEGLPRPIIEYVGIVQDRVDANLLEQIALAFPSGSLVLVGPVTTPGRFERLHAFPNVHFLGRKSHQRVPALLQHADVCILPHVRSTFAASMNPLKLYEYLAAGRPVVAMRVDGLQNFESLVSFADNGDDFVESIHDVLDGETAAARQARQSFISACDWGTRIDRILTLLTAELSPQARCAPTGKAQCS